MGPGRCPWCHVHLSDAAEASARAAVFLAHRRRCPANPANRLPPLVDLPGWRDVRCPGCRQVYSQPAACRGPGHSQLYCSLACRGREQHRRDLERLARTAAVPAAGDASYRVAAWVRRGGAAQMWP